MGPSCFVSRPRNISLSHTRVRGTSKFNVNLYWNATVKDTRQPYCNGTRRWRVGFIKYNSIEDRPTDFTKVAPSQWTNVHRRNTEFTFTEQFKNTSYYIFFVGHRPDKLDVRPGYFETLPSTLYFFGHQGVC